ncbi:MAG: hypothetical protein JNJ48_04430, partial [Phycisphaerae bacterium]|nr:hypothetical protein [Phycisphaerae bacterium]
QPAAPVPAPRIGGRLLREGAFLTGRRGRMVRADDGHWVFAFDNSTSSRAEPAMILLPCLTMAAMEKVAERAGDASTMTISGQVFVYKGRNYLLPTSWQVNRRTDLVPNQ